MKAKLYTNIYCPKCDWIMERTDAKAGYGVSYLVCRNRYCELKGIEYEIPEVELRPKKVKLSEKEEAYHCIDCSKLWTVYCSLKGIERKGTDDSCDDFLPLEKGF